MSFGVGVVSFRNRNRNLKISKALLKCQAHQGAATNQRGFSKGWSRVAQVRFPEYQEGTARVGLAVN